jgi:dihydrofolate reductase
MRKLVYYVASTIDGFVAGPDGEVEHFPVEPDLLDFIREEYPETLPTHVRSAIGLDVPNRRFDALVMGRGTYEPALKVGIASPYAHLRQYVFSRSLAGVPDPGVEVVAGDAAELVRGLKREPGRDIWLCGGGDLAGQLFGEIDELVVKLSPVVQGAGVPVLARAFDPVRFELSEARPLPSGVVVLHYARRGTP